MNRAERKMVNTAKKEITTFLKAHPEQELSAPDLLKKIDPGYSLTEAQFSIALSELIAKRVVRYTQEDAWLVTLSRVAAAGD